MRDIIHTKDDSNPCWWIPLSYSTQSNLHFNVTTPKHWMSCPRHSNVIENLAGDNEWVIFNNQMAGKIINQIKDIRKRHLIQSVLLYEIIKITPTRQKMNELGI